VAVKLAYEGSLMKKLFLVALFSMPLLSIARGEEGTMKPGDSMQQQGDAMKPDAKKSSQKAKKAKKKDARKPMQGDGMTDGGSMKHDGMMEEGTKK
jgi:hypothetical protein